MVFGWVWETCCLDFIGVTPLVRLSIEDFIVGRATFKATLSKMIKHEKMCFDNRHAFYSNLTLALTIDMLFIPI
jgi:hypothetical protein